MKMQYMAQMQSKLLKGKLLSFSQIMKFVQEPVKTKTINLLDFDRKGLAAFFVGLGEKPFRATQLLKWIYQEGVEDFNLMTDMSKTLRAYLTENCTIATPEI